VKNSREEWYDGEKKIAVTIVDVTEAAQELARGHLTGPVSTHYLAKALASAALLGAETCEKDESVSIQMKCSGPLGGFNVECTSEGELRGYTEKKLLDDFDGLGKFSDKDVLGETHLQVTRSVPGKILSQGMSNSLDGYLAGSLQRKACIYLECSVNDEVEVAYARGVMVEVLPDSKESVTDFVPEKLAVSSRNILSGMNLSRAELKSSKVLKFGCRCSPERAAAMLGALSDSERKTLPSVIDITCHMCGRTFCVKNK
jgi:molecular chaperone Hsp33